MESNVRRSQRPVNKGKRMSFLVLTAVLLALSLTGCSSSVSSSITDMWKDQMDDSWEAVDTAVEVHEDGTLTETILDTLDQSWYDASALQEMIDSSAADYNAQTGADHITVTSVSVEDGQVSVVLDYLGGEDYTAYNRMAFFAGSMLGAQMEGYLFSGSFYKVTDGALSQSTMDSEEPLSHKEYMVVVTEASHLVHVPGKIVYLSANGVLDDACTAHLSETAEVQETGSDEEEQDQAYLYIIYDA